MIRPAISLAALLLVGCATPGAQQHWSPDPTFDVPPETARSNRDAYGALRLSGSNPYAAFRAKRVGDTVQVIVQHQVNAGSKAMTSLSRSNTTDASVSAMFGLEEVVTNAPQQAEAEGVDLGFQPSLSVRGSTTNDFDGDGTTSRSGALNTLVTARVVGVQSNGHLVLAARQMVKINNEVDTIWLYGVVSPRRIDREGRVASTHLSDLLVEYSGLGVVADKQRPGWMARILDLIAPF